MTRPTSPNIALCGVKLESNAFSPITTETDFRQLCYAIGDDIVTAARGEASTLPTEMCAFVQAMDVTGPWQPVPLICAAAHPWGPVAQTFFDQLIAHMIERLQAAGPVDGVYVANHGAMVATGDPDPDGTMLAKLRAAVGPKVPIIVTLDLHANISETMVESADVLVSYLTNPHVDMMERGEEAAFLVRTLLGGNAAPQTAFIRMPIAPPSVTLLSAQGPYAELIDYGQRRKREMAGAILNVSILGTFVYSDTPYNGIGIVVTGRHQLEPAQRLAREIAERCWADRARFQKTLTPLEEAVAKALDNAANPGKPALIYADVGDNPGGGGGGDTVELLSALVAAGAKDVLYGSYYDPNLVRDAIAAGVGAQMEAVFNRTPKTRFAQTYRTHARVLKVSYQPFVGRLGIYAGREVLSQPSCVLELGGENGIKVVIISNRYQTADPMFFEHHGLDIAAARTVCVKSRGHFRAGFAPWFAPEQVLEIDTAGFTSPVLDRFEWNGLPRPIFPLDQETDWVPPNW